jgi:hypothetical protein
MVGMTGPFELEALAGLAESTDPSANAATPDTTALPARCKSVRRLIVRASASLANRILCSSIMFLLQELRSIRPVSWGEGEIGTAKCTYSSLKHN